MTFAELRGSFFDWCLAHPLESIGLAIFILSNLATALTKYPRASGFLTGVRALLDLISCLPHKDSPAYFTLPLVQRSPPPPPELEAVQGGKP